MHLKYRPQNFNEVLGNAYIKRVLQNMTEYRPIMFEGEKGAGKTSLAYIVAKEFGAPPENVTDINCVHFSKIEDMRGRMESLGRSSIFGNKKVLILDEIHMLSLASQKVLLKPLENLPNNVLILACTTTTEKVVGPLLDRFIRLRVKALSKKESKQLVNSISKKEGIVLEKQIEVLLLEKSEGNPRRLLTNLAKLRSVSDIDEATYLLDTSIIEEVDVLTLWRALSSGLAWSTCKVELQKLLKDNTPESIRIGLLNLISGKLMSNYLRNDIEGKKLVTCSSILKKFGFPEKAILIADVYCVCNIFTDGGEIKWVKE